jgi:hypothetical protein
VINNFENFDFKKNNPVLGKHWVQPVKPSKGRGEPFERAKKIYVDL